MNHSTHRWLAPLAAVALLATACGSSDDASTDTTDDTSAVETAVTDDAETTESSDTELTATDTSAEVNATSLFVDGALSSDATTVDCTLENGTETICSQLKVASLASTIDTDGPFWPATTSDIGGIWVWDGDDPGLYALDSDFWDMMTAQGYEFADTDGNISIVDPAGGAPGSTGTANSCLQASPDDSFHLQVLLPTAPEDLDTPTDLSTVAQMMQLARKGSAYAEPEVFDVADVVSDVVDDLRSAHPDRSINCRIPSDIESHIAGVSGQIHQAVLNLGANACGHSDDEVLVRLTADDAHLEIAVVDHGPGIDEDDRERIFQPFVRLDASRTRTGTAGAGLGLALTNQIAASHHSTIRVSDTPGGGATVTLRLPRR